MFEKNPVLYYMFHVFGFILTVVYTIVIHKRFKLPFWRTVLFIVTVFPIAYAFMWFQYWVESGFKSWGNNIVRTFIWVPFISIPFAKLYKIDLHKAIELLAPIPCIIHGIAHFGCIFEGCCYGYPYANGIWNPTTKDYRFPNQPIEAAVAVLIVIFIIWWIAKHEFSGKSKAYALMLILFGSTRFFLEFARDNEKLFLGISSLALHALLMFGVGLFFFLVPFDRIKEERELRKMNEQKYQKKPAKAKK